MSEAIEAINRALELTPKNAQAISLKGYLEMSLNRIAEAQQSFSAAIEIDPALANAWLGRGLAFYPIRRPPAGAASHHHRRGRGTESEFSQELSWQGVCRGAT